MTIYLFQNFFNVPSFSSTIFLFLATAWTNFLFFCFDLYQVHFQTSKTNSFMFSWHYKQCLKVSNKWLINSIFCCWLPILKNLKKALCGGEVVQELEIPKYRLFFSKNTVTPHDFSPNTDNETLFHLLL